MSAACPLVRHVGRTGEVASLRDCALVALALLCLLSMWHFAIDIAPLALGSNSPSAQQGLLPEWTGCREVLLRHASPYTEEVTRRIQIAVYGAPAAPGVNQQRFAYPVYVVVLFLPLTVMPFGAARICGVAGCLVMTALSAVLWPGMFSRGRLRGVAITILIFSAYPVVLGLQLCQPTLLVAGLLALVIYWARSGRMASAGMLAALCTAKPQLAVAVLLPLCLWALVGWRQRRRFLSALAISVAGLLLASELAVPGWFSEWLGTVRAYSHYAGARPLLLDWLGPHLWAPVAGLLVIAVVWVSLRFANIDLLLVISFSIAVFQLLFPFLIYNEVLLLPAALWLADNCPPLEDRGELPFLLWSCSWIVLGAGWTAALGLTLWDYVSPGSGVKLWPLPLLAAWLYPWTVFAALAACVTAPATLSRSQP